MAPRKLLTPGPLHELRERLRREGRVVVWTNGCFDLLHVGHVRNLQAAKALGDVLIVGINSDDSVRRLKGPERPLLPADERAELLAALECVDFVTVFDELTPDAVLAQLKPDIHCKGADYAPPHGKPVPEQTLVESYGGRVAFLPLVEGHSTTDLVRRIKDRRPAAFLDRDGTLIVDANYPKDPNVVRLLPGAVEAMKSLRSAGFRLVVISNQSGVGRGMITPDEARAVHERFVELVSEHEITFDGVYYCPHGPDDGCDCRKPAPGMILKAAAELGLDLSRSVMIGDKPADVEAGTRAGCRGILIADGDWDAVLAEVRP